MLVLFMIVLVSPVFKGTVEGFEMQTYSGPTAEEKATANADIQNIIKRNSELQEKIMNRNTEKVYLRDLDSSTIDAKLEYIKLNASSVNMQMIGITLVLVILIGVIIKFAFF